MKRFFEPECYLDPCNWNLLVIVYQALSLFSIQSALSASSDSEGLLPTWMTFKHAWAFSAPLYICWSRRNIGNNSVDTEPFLTVRRSVDTAFHSKWLVHRFHRFAYPFKVSWRREHIESPSVETLTAFLYQKLSVTRVLGHECRHHKSLGAVFPDSLVILVAHLNLGGDRPKSHTIQTAVYPLK